MGEGQKIMMNERWVYLGSPWKFPEIGRAHV